MSKILVIRFSAIGDVAMTIPVVASFAAQYPDEEIYFLSHKRLATLFEGLPNNIHFIGADLKGEHATFGGLRQLFKSLKSHHFSKVIDLHDVLRSKYLRFRFLMSGVPCWSILKGRGGKKALARNSHKKKIQLKTSVVRYTEVFERAGYHFDLDFHSLYEHTPVDLSAMKEQVGEKTGNQKWIGVAPFAAHQGKIYPLEKMLKVLGHFANRTDCKVFLFGGGPKEEQIFNDWVSEYPQLVSLAGKFDLSKELQLMSKLDVMISMDSANMHLASLVATPVVSIWGQTHVYAGFLGYNQKEENCVALDMSCRPCSIYGNKPCYRKDFACMNNLSEERVIAQIESVIN